jgi:hypothetical protein
MSIAGTAVERAVLFSYLTELLKKKIVALSVYVLCQ